MSKISIGQMRDFITFLAPAPFDELADTRKTYNEVGNAWSYARYVSDAEKFRANSLKQTVNIRFTVRKQPLDRNWRIRFDGQLYEINGYKPIDYEFIEITCGEIV